MLFPAVIAGVLVLLLLLFYGVLGRLYLIISCRDNLVGLSCWPHGISRSSDVAAGAVVGRRNRL